MSSSTTSTTSGTWHEYYADPLADLTLLSNDGVLFKASSYHLARASSVFASMKSTATKPSPEPIDIDASSRILAIFLDLAHLSELLTPKTTATETMELIQLCFKFDCRQEMLAVLNDRMGMLKEAEPWKVFAAASELKDSRLAREALQCVKRLDDMLWDHLAEATTDYRRESILLFCKKENPHYGSSYVAYQVLLPDTAEWTKRVQRFHNPYAI